MVVVEDVGVAVSVMEAVGVPVVVDVRVVVVVPETVTLAVAVEEVVIVGLTDAASWPTTRLTPQTSGSERVAE